MVFKDRLEFFTEENCHVLELSNSAADEEVSIARIRVEAHKTTSWHRLKNTTERYLILSGHGLLELENHDPVKVFPNSVSIIPASQAPRITNLTDEDLIFFAICSPRFVQENYETLE